MHYIIIGIECDSMAVIGHRLFRSNDRIVVMGQKELKCRFKSSQVVERGVEYPIKADRIAKFEPV